MKSKNSNGTGGLTQSVMRALSILSCFNDQTPQLRMTDISQRLNLTTSLVSRILATLEHDGFVEQDPASGMYHLGRAVLTLAGVALNHNQLRMEALTEMQDASSELGLGVNLSVLDGDAMFYLAHIETPETPRPYTLIGRRNPLHATGMGKVLLAFLPENEQKAILKRLDLVPYSVHTRTNADDLLKELAQIRERGWGVEMEELALGRACIAGPIRDSSGTVVGALSFSGPLSQIQWDQRKEQLTKKIIEVCDRISMRLGYISAPGMRRELQR
ncbi:MAG: IclR family transcriptional regulator [Aggregatilineales bacterium]